MHRFAFTALMAAVVLAGCTTSDESGPPERPAQVTLGPVDGRELPGVDLERIQVGDPAPDFSLASLAGPVVTLSQFRGQKNVILVFYRGYW